MLLSVVAIPQLECETPCLSSVALYDNSDWFILLCIGDFVSDRLELEFSDTVIVEVAHDI